jgi:zinc transporter, ZIP family
MNFADTVLLGAIAGFTIYLGLPVARWRNPRRDWQAFLNALATGILVFLFFDVVAKAREPIDAAMEGARDSGSAADLIQLLVLFALGFGVGLLGLVYVDRAFVRRHKVGGEIRPMQLALMIAAGIGVHNFAEGLAIGQASRSGAIELATILIVGFGLHNMTEGFGVAAPLTLGSTRATWAFLGLAGLIGGGPTFLGTVLGFSVEATPVFVLCLALAAGSILYVVAELLHVGRRFQVPELVSWGVFIGFALGFGTDLLLTWAGV